METDAVPEMPIPNEGTQKSTSSKSKKKDLPNAPINQNISVVGNVFNFNNATNLQIGHVLNFGGPIRKKKSSRTSKVNNENPKKSTEEMASIAAIMKSCVDTVTTTDIEIIRDLIQSPWKELANNIMTHTDRIDNRLANPEAVKEVLFNWIEEHDSSALVAILVSNLWEMHETTAAKVLAEKHYK